MDIFTRELIKESTVLTPTNLLLETIDLADIRNDSFGVIGLEFIGTGVVNIDYSSTLTEGDSTWKSLGPITLVTDIRQMKHFSVDEPHFGRYYKFRVNGDGSTITKLTVGMV